jgi:hypothetical protein
MGWRDITPAHDPARWRCRRSGAKSNGAAVRDRLNDFFRRYMIAVSHPSITSVLRTIVLIGTTG